MKVFKRLYGSRGADANLNMCGCAVAQASGILEILNEDKIFSAEVEGTKANSRSRAGAVGQGLLIGPQGARHLRPKMLSASCRTMSPTCSRMTLLADEEVLVEREAVDVVVFEGAGVPMSKGPCRFSSRPLPSRPDDKLDRRSSAEMILKLLLLATVCCFLIRSTVAKLPLGRGHGEPIRMFIDMEQGDADSVVVRQQGAHVSSRHR